MFQVREKAEEGTMIESHYTAYAPNGDTVKEGFVTHETDIDGDHSGPVNFFEAVVADVGEERFENEVFGIKD